jgi:hypothetical protein
LIDENSTSWEMWCMLDGLLGFNLTCGGKTQFYFLGKKKQFLQIECCKIETKIKGKIWIHEVTTILLQQLKTGIAQAMLSSKYISNTQGVQRGKNEC